MILSDVLNGKKINEVLERTINAIQTGKQEIFDIAENTRKECETIKKELEDIVQRIKKLIKEVDLLEIKERKSRTRLAVVSRDFKKYTEEDIKKAYEISNNLRIKLMLKRREEKELIIKRNELERRLKVYQETLKKAEKLVAQVGVALEYLSGDLDKIAETFEDLSKRQMLGIKIIKAQEEERQRVARDIHDGPAQSLANVVLKTEICEKMMSIDQNKAKDELKELKGIVRDSLKDVRKIIYDLRPMSLDDLGLIPTVQRYGELFYEETGIDVNVRVIGKKTEINSYMQLAVFRIIQEALNNVKKHSEATKVDILIEIGFDNFNLIIKDNGNGFDKSEIDSDNSNINDGFGLMGMRERAELLKGNFEIKSSLGKGTKITLTLPTNRKDDLDE